MKLALVLSFVGLVQYSGAQIVQDELCNSDVQLQKDFDADKFEGQWYEIKRSASQSRDDCATIDIAKNTEASGYKFTYTGVSRNVAKTSHDVATLEDGTAKFGLNLNGTDDTDFRILKTDYNNYALAYRCDNISPSQRSVSLWILGREKAVAPEIEAELRTILDSQLKIDIEDLETVDNSAQACYVPLMTRNDIILEGPCNPNFPAVANFDANRFQGQWHVVSSYYSANALGSCNRARYNLVGDVVDVVNSQVVDQRLEEIKGNATVNSNDGRGRLMVRLEIMPGVMAEQELFIVDTNYDDWGISYSCINMGGSTRKVNSWIVSRSKALSAESEQAVADVIASIDDLVTENYLPADQSAEACFYKPEPKSGVPVVYPGQCDESIPVVNNFNLGLFQGVWHEIEAHPKEEQGGQCIRHQFTSGTDNSLNLQTTSVYDIFRDTTRGALTFASFDNSAKMTIITDNGITIPYWILSTDYQNYALAYSCVNKDDDFRAVYSWKLSRTEQLTPQAIAQINVAMANVAVLDQVYYEPIDQSTTGCSHLKDLTPGEQVILPGQCSPDVPVVKNFDAGKYLGRWKLIENLPSTFQDGKCNRAEYSLRPDGSVTVSNTQVKDQTLESDIGIALLIPSDDGSGKLSVTFPNNPNTVEYWVLSTDYESYSFVYSCINISDVEKLVLSWKLSRYDWLSDEAVNSINEVMSTIDELNNRYYMKMDNSEEDCFYYPEPQQGVPVIFPGQCDENISVVANFNLALFQGAWYEIEAYPKEQQGGQCIRHQFTPEIGNSLNLQTTSVYDIFRDTTRGVMTFASFYNSAKMTIITDNGIRIPYWILATDYENYALAYSCVNKDDDFRAVYSWKLSRTEQLTPQAIAQINEAVANVAVMDQVYYEPIDQSTVGCSHLTDLKPGEQVLVPRRCSSNIDVVKNFDAGRYLGRWKLIESYPSTFQDGKCNRANYSLRPDGKVEVLNTQVKEQSLESDIGIASLIPSDDGSGKLSVTFPDNPNTVEYWVLSTDYESYSFVYSCININDLQSLVLTWKLSRYDWLSDEAVNSINEVMSTIDVLNNRYYQKMDNSAEDCFYYPEPQQGVPVIFPGQCDENISVVDNFNLGLFQGAWYEIEAHPKEQQGGQCIRHQFTSGTDNSLNLQTTSVYDIFRDTTRGALTFASSDNSAKMTIITDNGITIPYWILSTDYQNYALAYSCVNKDDDFRAVYSWKLSRTEQLTPQAIAQINDAIDNVAVLDQVYYEPIDQSTTGCSHLKDLTPGEQVILPGQCSPDISVVKNFDAGKYLGRWKLIESLPSTFQDGKCNRAEYSLRPDGSVTVSNTQVKDQSLESDIGIASLIPSNDGSAKLSVTFPNNPNTVEYWVLSTDYESYSFVYSCINISDVEKLVLSWKLSRYDWLSDEAINAINEVMSTIDVLNNRYYQKMDNSEEDCFYYPEPQPGVPVIFPGQCNENIPVVDNFNIGLFQGAWYEIEAHPKEQQGGQCIRHQFTSGTDNSLNLQTTSVYDIFRDTSRGALTFASSDNSAKMTIITDNGIIIPYWILSTDYQNYALAYSCVNKDDDFQAVYSWKLSRTEQLTPQAIAQINDAIDNVAVLDQVYYEPIDQSTTGCSHLTDLTPGEQVIMPGQCRPDISVVKNFDAGKYLGRWKLIESLPSTFQDGKCNRANYSLRPDGTVEVLNTQIKDQSLESDIGIASLIPSDDGSGKLNVTFPNNPNPVEYWVLSTDYESYSFVYSCINISDMEKLVLSWKLSRYDWLSDEAVNSINEVMSTIDELNNRYYQKMDNSEEDCFYYPEPEQGVTVTFPGLCSPNIQAMPNFNASRYLGLWYEIESYPSPFQNGQCSNAFYSLGNNGIVDVINSQVIGQTLDTQIGTAQVMADDGRAKLIVDFIVEVDGIEFANQQEYYVMDTDYETYSVVYSCRNLDDGESRQVNSWKLSRTKTLPPDANAKINEAIENIVELDQRYYFPNDQSQAGCFYNPKPQPGVPVVYPGQCDESITVVNNFNLGLFQGDWYEIEAYPKVEQQGGQCIRHQFTSGTDNSLNLQTTSVYDIFRDTTRGAFTFASSDDSAKMTIITDNGIIIPYWILSTDYQNYALAYSCVNKDDYFRAVYSWKLSRTEQLTPQAIAQINDAIANVAVLDQVYYEPIDQSTTGCSHLKDLTPGEQVILPGQCSPDISVVKNFDAGKYLGRWKLIESLPSTFQDGKCNRAEYSLRPDGSVTVSNTQVKDQSLESDIGIASLIPSDDGSAKLSVTFPNNPNTVEYWVLSTDYESYSFVYSCINISDVEKLVLSWKLSRYDWLSDEAVNSINEVISTIDVLNNRYYQKMDNSEEDCFYYPEPQPGAPVVFPGQCDESISVVDNFNLELFQGAWYEIEAYPKVEQQGGQCIRHQFTSGTDNSLNLQTTSVYDIFRDTTRGALTFASSDNSAKMTIITDNGIIIPYWILSTDYQNYALAYSCVNKDDDFRAVYSWKISRTEQLTPQAIAQINDAIDNVAVMDQVYYEPIDQTTTGCSHLKDLTSGEQVILPGQCRPDISVVKNFDAGKYLGRWKLIESLPSTFQDGKCNRAEYSLRPDGSVTVSNTQVKDQSLESDIGIASLIPSDDGSAKLSVTFPNNPNTVEYWVLSTDYESYSFVYSCINISNVEKLVLSWKLSRYDWLSDEAVNSINEVMSTIDELNSRYYVKMDNSEEDCFYYPEPQLGVPVKFPGQCDENIPVVDNFNSGLFQGAWNEIEAHPKEQQRGQCIRHQFTLGTDNNLNMESTSVYSILRETTKGVLSSSSNGNSNAKMSLTFSSFGQVITIPFWILATDYDNYAFAYSCVNIDEDFRGVYAWKLSRNQQLLPAAEIEINNVIANVQVLGQEYLEPIDQSYEACFFIPPGDAVMVPGQCDPDIPVVTSFDPLRYVGRWKLMANYPSEFQDGDCNEARYTILPDGTVEVYNTQVVNETLKADTGIAAVAPSDDGSAKLIVNFPESPVPIDYWVLATDYDSYSLVYSCLNMSPTQKRIWSWKLTRSGTLTEEANNIMDGVISTVDVLNNDYYKIGENSDAACFYYPDIEIGPGATIELPGRCDESIRGIPEFKAAAYLGTWYEVERYPTGDQFGKCGAANYTDGEGVVNVVNTQVSDEQLLTQEGFAVVTSTDGRGELSVNFIVQGEPRTANYYILATDYEHYACVYSCRNTLDDTRIVTSWKLSRDKDKDFTPEAKQAISEAISRTQGLRDDFYIPTGQSNDDCFYYPQIEVGPGVVIELPGSCPTIQAQPNFNAAAYLGTWYEVRRYPTGDQFGECARAEYTTENGVIVNVWNTQVVGERLLTQGGVAVVASTDGSGLLTVTFNVQGVIIIANYYVINTDYNNYALVYSCRNIADNNRIVSSWILSKQKTGLSALALETINEYINSTQGLREDYYLSTSQNDDDCFYVPEVDMSQNNDVIFSGQCDDITGVQNFDMQRYLGWWHEIERYPSSSQTAECTSSQFQASGNQFQVVDMSVVDQNGLSDSSTLQVTSDGRLRRILNNGQIVDTWVLATDYETYSLLYSCENIDDEYRRVWSAKHSKARQLTNAAQNAMNPLIQNNRVLRPEFYREVDQGDDACFYYPEANGQPVVMPGNCDESIPVVQNFQPGEYSGTWYQMARYPQQFEMEALCTGARYTVDDDIGGVTVDNWEVIGGELDIISGTATLTSNDGSAKLEVVLPARGEGAEGNVTSPLYVLTTDYTTYSLAYSCVNINDFQRRVGVWQLSRTRGMPWNAANTINEYMATRPELDQRYFIQVQHNEDCLEPASGSSTIIGSVIVIVACMLANIFV